jgi:hypothetical protein
MRSQSHSVQSHSKQERLEALKIIVIEPGGVRSPGMRVAWEWYLAVVSEGKHQVGSRQGKSTWLALIRSCAGEWRS